jgi:hypothetical protein
LNESLRALPENASTRVIRASGLRRGRARYRSPSLLERGALAAAARSGAPDAGAVLAYNRKLGTWFLVALLLDVVLARLAS